MWREGNARGVVRQVLELLLLWPQGRKGAGRRGGLGRDDVVQGGLVVRKKQGSDRILLKYKHKMQKKPHYSEWLRCLQRREEEEEERR